MKAQTKITLANGDTLKVTETLETMINIWGRMNGSQPGSVFGVEQITDHGTVKRAAIMAGTIFRLEEA